MSKAITHSWIQIVQDCPSWPKWKSDPNQTVSDGEVNFKKILLQHRRPTLALIAPPSYRDIKVNTSVTMLLAQTEMKNFMIHMMKLRLSISQPQLL